MYSKWAMEPDLSQLPEWSRPWAEHRLSQGFHDISSEQWNGLRDWLTALPTERPKMPAKLHKLTMAQALEASALWHKDMSRQAERIRDNQSSFGGDPDAVEVLSDSGQGWRWVRVTSPEGLDYEGNAMGHCVGRGGYDTGVTIISLRDKYNMPHCTIEWNERKRIVKQVQGRANGPVVEKYHEAVLSFINGLEPLAVQGVGKFGHVLVEGKLVHWSKLPDGLTLKTINLAGCTSLTHLPDGLSLQYLRLEGCTDITQLPDGLSVKILDLSGCTGLTHLPDGLNTQRLYLMDCTGLTHLPGKLRVEYLDLEGCTSLTHLPDGLTAEYLDLKYCTGLLNLPDGLNLEYLTIEGCTGLTHLPDGLSVKILCLMGCTGITHLPDGLGADYLDIRGCTGLTSLPSDLNLDCQVYGGDHLIRRNNRRI